ncbi:MAG: hypothetical protein ACREA0_12435, partial [bacterium]
MDWSTALTANAWAGEEGPVSGTLSNQARGWATQGRFPSPQEWLGPPDLPDERDWKHERIGWGLVLAEPDGDWSAADKAQARDAPEPLQALIASRGAAPVLRYHAELRDRKLRRYYNDGTVNDPEIGLSATGVGRGQIPRYLLVYGDPVAIPWSLQYALNRSHAVGRLDLTGAALDNYVTALLGSWDRSGADPVKATVWTVDTGPDDITSLMRRSLADPIARKLAEDDETTRTLSHLRGDTATHQLLVDNLASHHPAVVVTTSHGKTGPLDNSE